MELKNILERKGRTKMATKARKRATPPRVRRTNAERSAETRSVLIEAAIDILYRQGFSAATTIEVAARANVSRGAMLHQFPTRVDLLLAVAQHIVTIQREQRRAKTLKINPGLERYYAAADINWEVQKQPSTIALLEIMMATRNDRDLRKGFAPFIKQMVEMRSQAAARVAQDLGVDDTTTVANMLHLHQATLRGLAIDLLFTEDPEDVEKARKLFTHYSHTFANSLIARAKASRD
jgi:AcrR family transcriptional regulator